MIPMKLPKFFKTYKGKPIDRHAVEVKPEHLIAPTGNESESKLTLPDGQTVTFKHYEPVRDGDFIVYIKADDVYHCSREVFMDRNHLPVQAETFDFGEAIKALKTGSKVARIGWNGSGMYAYYVNGGVLASKNVFDCQEFGARTKYRPYLALKTAQNDIATWNPSTSDILAEDWHIV